MVASRQRIVPGHIPVWEDMLWSLGRGDAFMYKDGRDGLNKKGNAMKIPWNTTEFIEDIENIWKYLCFVWCNNLDVSLLGTAYRSRIGPLCWSFIAFCFSFHSFHSFPVSIISRRWALKKEPSQSFEPRARQAAWSLPMPCREISFFVAMLKNVSDLTGWTKPVKDELKWW